MRKAIKWPQSWWEGRAPLAVGAVLIVASLAAFISWCVE